MDPIKIPQNVYVEDRIIGPVTLRQIIICMLGGGFSYALFASLQKMYGSVGLPLAALVWTPAILAAAFAFVKINDLSLFHMCMLFLERMNKPMKRTWSPRRGIVINFQIQAPKEAQGIRIEKSAEQRSGLEKLSTILDTGDTVEHEGEDLHEESPPKATEQRPIDRNKIKAEPLTEGHSIDQIQRDEEEKTSPSIHPSVSLFRDITPPQTL